MTLPGRQDDTSPRAIAEMLCETHRQAGKPFTNELVKELAIELQACVTKLPFNIAEKYIRLFDPVSQKKEETKREQKARRKAEEIYNFALSLCPLVTDPMTRLVIIAVDLRRQFPGLSFEKAKEIVRKALNEYDEAKDKEPELKPAHQLLEETEEKTSAISASTTESPQGIREISRIRKPPVSSSVKPLTLGPKFEDILVLVKSQVCYYRTLSKTLKVAYTTIKDRVDFLIEQGFLYRVPKSYPIRFELTQHGIQYLENHFTKLLKEVVEGLPPEKSQDAVLHAKTSDLVQDSQFTDPQTLEKSAPISNPGVKVTRKIPKADSVTFDSLRFSQTLEEYLRNLPSDYPKDPIFLNRPHYITYKFRVLQQDRYLTHYGQNEKGLLAKQTWCSALSIDPFDTIQMTNWVKYQGSLFFHKVRYFIIFTTKHVIIRFPFLFTHTPLESAERIVQMIFIAKRELEDLFSTKRTKFILGSIDPDYIAYCVFQHYSILFTPLSVVCDQLGLALEDQEGRVRIDASRDVPETEAIHSRFGLDDVIFAFKDLVWQVNNEYGVKEAHADIATSESRISTNEILLNKLNNQCLILEDQKTLTNQRVSVLEGNLELISYYLAETTRQLRDSTIINSSQFEQMEETLSSIQERLDTFTFIKRPKFEQVILDFLRRTPNELGFTRNDLAIKLNLPLGTVSPTITKLHKEGLIIIHKEGNIAGRIFFKNKQKEVRS